MKYHNLRCVLAFCVGYSFIKIPEVHSLTFFEAFNHILQCFEKPS